MKKNAVLALGGVVVVVVVVSFAIIFKHGAGDAPQDVIVRYGITPYQDSALPVVPEKLGWYKEQGMRVELVPVTWGEVVTSLSGGAIDVAIYNFNSFEPPYENAAQGSRKPVFYCPLFLFKGQAIMVRSDAGMKVFRSSGDESRIAREERIASVVKQLKGKRVGVTEGTELEQLVLAALKKAGLRKEDVVLVHSSPEDSLAAFLAGDLDAFAAGLTERTEARRRGATELLVTSDVMLPVVDGIVTTEEFANKHPEVLDKLVNTWFRTIRFVGSDVKANSAQIRSYLEGAASTRYSPEEYEVAWTFDVFPRDANEAFKLFSDESSPGYWKSAWDSNNDFLKQQGKVNKPVPYSAYWGDRVLQRLANK